MTLTATFAAALVALLAAAAWRLHRPDLPRDALRARYAQPPSRFLDVDGATLHLRDEGPRDAPPVLLLHGFGSSLHAWDDWAPPLAERFRVIRLDLPGFGLTGADPSGDYSDARSVALLAALLDRLGASRAHVVGSSMGGRIAWRFASQRPDRVDRLVLMAPDGFSETGRYGEPPRSPPAARLLPWVLPERPLRRMVAAGFADPARLTEALFARYRDMMLAPGVRRAMLVRMSQQPREDPAPFLARISAPTLLLWGEQDRMVPAANAAEYERRIADCRAVILDGVGHVPMEEAPDRSLAPVLAFLSA